MPKKITYKEAKEIFYKKNLKLLETEYKNKDIKMKYKCIKCNYMGEKKLGDVKNNSGCPQCYNKKRGKSQRKSFNDVKNLFVQNNMELLEKEYINSSTKMKYKCKLCNYIGEKTYGNLKQRKGCPNCYGNIKKTLNEINIKFNEKKLILLESEYGGAHTPMKYKCKICNYIGKKSYRDVKKSGCWLCAINDNKGENHPNWNPNKTLLQSLRNKSNRYQSACRNLIINDNINFKLYKQKYGWLIKDMKNFIKNYKNLKNEKFTVDHILPLNSLLKEGIVICENDITDKLISHINSINNFQILLDKENIIKSDSYLKEDFDKYISNYV